IANDTKQAYSASNNKLRKTYTHIVNSIEAHLGPLKPYSVGEIGCNTGYFLLELSRRGARKTVGYDRANYAPAISLMNSILGTNTQFRNAWYDPSTQSVRGAEKFDIVLSSHVICHLSDTLQHLAYLGSMARKALFIWTPVSPKDDLSITFSEPNKYYKGDVFPFCFDFDVLPSRKMVRKSLELMGFNRQYEFSDAENGLPESFSSRFITILGIRD
ncbi:MAG: class I SAM-dependent methyltransferase, partial [Candidatus Sericytochromatia bacterium]